MGFQISDLAENLPPKRLGGNGFWDLPPKMEAFPPKILGGNEKFWGGTAFEESRSPPKSETLGGAVVCSPPESKTLGGQYRFRSPPTIWGGKASMGKPSQKEG